MAVRAVPEHEPHVGQPARDVELGVKALQRPLVHGRDAAVVLDGRDGVLHVDPLPSQPPVVLPLLPGELPARRLFSRGHHLGAR